MKVRLVQYELPYDHLSSESGLWNGVEMVLSSYDSVLTLEEFVMKRVRARSVVTVSEGWSELMTKLMQRVQVIAEECED